MKTCACFLLLAILASNSFSDEIGRLFYSPEQRASLEKYRLQQRTQQGRAIPIISKPITYDGVVIRSDGHATQWINGKPKIGGAYMLEARGKKIKPGQSLDQGKVHEAHSILRPDTEETP